jgi:hypothetical protein
MRQTTSILTRHNLSKQPQKFKHKQA